jgi:hypothetical protein
MYREVTEEEIEEAAAIDWSEVFKDSFMEPFDIKLPERPAEDVELLDGPPVRPKARERRTRISRRNVVQQKTQVDGVQAKAEQLLFAFEAELTDSEYGPP